MATLKVVLLLGIAFFAALAMAQAGEAEKDNKDIGEMKRCRCCHYYHGCKRYCCSAPDGTVRINDANEKEAEESTDGYGGGYGHGGGCKYGCCYRSYYACKKCCSSPDEKPVEVHSSVARIIIMVAPASLGTVTFAAALVATPASAIV